MDSLKIPLLLGLFISISSCANYKLNYTKEAETWEQQRPDPDLRVSHSMFLVGDAGGVGAGQEGPALRLLEKKLKAAGDQSSVIFLGDNIYPNGLAPKEEEEERAEDEYRLLAQLKTLDGYTGRPFFIAGNHDWYWHGLKGVKRQKDFVEEYLDNKDVFFPDPGCGGPEEIELSENLVLIIIDSQWFLSNWEGETEINDGCEAKSRAVFKLLFEEAIKGNRSKNVVVALHHPLYTNGPHGGQFTWKQHLFPLTELNDNLWLPMPVIGSMYPFLRATAGPRQDLSHPRYKELKDALIAAARKNGHFIFASGHEHSLQYAEVEGQSFIVSGSGSKLSATKTGRGTTFAFGHRGFTQIDFYEDGSAWAIYWVADENNDAGRVVFRKQLNGPLEKIVEKPPTSFPPMRTEVEIPISQDDFTRSQFGEWIWGTHYREAYNTVIKVPTLDLNTYKGGVVPVKKGGGYQTNSLRLEGSDGKQYSMRSLDKDATRTVPYPFTESFVAEVIKDNFSAAHPLSALAIPPLAKAAGIYHSNPKLYFVPRQPGLGRFNDDFGDALYLVEERADDDHWTDADNFGNPDDIISTPDLLEEALDDHEEMIDYPMVARHRIFDLLIGDWDRHDDQWRWAEKEQGERKLYQPIPRDRDQAFSNYDGFILSIARQTVPFGRQLRTFRAEGQKMRYASYNARHFDKTFLSGADWRHWEMAIREIQEALTDEVIESAFKDNWPEPIYALDGERIVETLKRRRDLLMDYAREHYLHLAERVDVVGTNKRDLFIVERLNDELTNVRVYDTNKKGEREGLIFERAFRTAETKEITLYGLDDEDIFELKGNVGKGIKVRMIGGLDEDTFTDESSVSHCKCAEIIDAAEEDSEVNVGNGTKVRLTNDPVLNTYNRKSEDYEYDYNFFLPSLSFNPDDGLLLGVFGQNVSYGFKKSPYAASHHLSLGYALRTSGLNAHYRGEFIDIVRRWDFLLEGRFQTPLYATNFYGFGNETLNPETEENEGLDFNRVRQRIIKVYPAFMRKLFGSSFIAFGPTYESIRIERTEGRYIDVVGDQFVPELFDGLEFVGARFVLDVQNADNPGLPTRGIGLKTDLGYKHQLDYDKSFAYIKAAFTAYLPLGPAANTVLATRVGVHHNFNQNYEFYQGATLGGLGPNGNMRGLRRDRFNGQTAFYQNIDLRIRLVNSSNKLLPFTLGVLGGFDYGRVWQPGEESELWHTSVGGGLWVSPFDMIVVNAGWFKGTDEQGTFLFGGAFFF